jgi:hypothetical protein
MRIMFEPEREKVTGVWRKLYEKLQNFIRMAKSRMSRACGMHGRNAKLYKI